MSNKGFTLVEVLVASVLFAIGMIAALAMQYSALAGFGSSRDLTNAIKVGDRVVNVIRAESQGWRSTDSPPAQSVYDTGLFKEPILSNLTWGWAPVFDAAVDVRLTDAGPRRYCAYARGGKMPTSQQMVQVQVAVVYPGANGVFPDNNCTLSKEPTIIGNLNPGSGPPSDLERKTEFRAVYTGAVIIKRDYISDDDTA